MDPRFVIQLRKVVGKWNPPPRVESRVTLCLTCNSYMLTKRDVNRTLTTMEALNVENLRQLTERGKFKRVLHEIIKTNNENEIVEQIREFVVPKIADAIQDRVSRGYSSYQTFLDKLREEVKDYLKSHHSIIHIERTWYNDVLVTILVEIATTCNMSYSIEHNFYGNVSTFGFKWCDST